MATTIRVYLDGGGTAYASAPMAADRTFAVSLLSVPAGTHTFEVTAQEDGKGESARVIQTVVVERGAQQTHPLAADILATGTVTADLTAPGPATQHALQASISAAATVAADLTATAVHALAASISASATTAADLTAPAGVTENAFAFAPDAILAYAETSAAPTVIVVQDDPDTYDGAWVVAQTYDKSPAVRVSFPTPPGTLSTGADKQEFRAVVRKFRDVAAVPTARLELWQNGVLVRAGPDATVTSLTGQVISFTWDASEVTSGASVECKVVVTKSTEANAADRNSADIGAVRWVGKTSGYVDLVDEFVGTAGANVDALKWATSVVAGSGSVTGTVAISAGNGYLNLTRTATGAGAVRVSAVGSFTSAAGRYIRLSDLGVVTTTGVDCPVSLAGATYVYEFEPSLGDVEWFDDGGEGYWLQGPVILVTKRNASTDALISTSTLNPLVTGAWPSAYAQLDFTFGAGTVEVKRADTGLVMGTANISDLGSSFGLGFTYRVGSSNGTWRACSRVEVGRV